MADGKKKTAPKKSVKRPAKARATKPAPKPLALVTGASGFTGSTMVDLLIERGYSVVATDREDTGFAYVRQCQAMIESNPERFRGQTVEIVPADLTKRETLRTVFRYRKIKHVFHAGAVFDMSAPWKLLYNVNVMGTRNLMEVALDARDTPETAILWSTALVYGPPERKKPIREDHPKNPVNYYARSKWEQELMATHFFEKGLRGAILRPSTVYGPRSRYGITKALMPLALGSFIQAMPLPGGGEYKTNYVHCDDVVGAALHIAEKIASKKIKGAGEAFNVCDDMHVSIRKSVGLISRALKVKTPTFRLPEKLITAIGDLMPYGMKIPAVNIEKEEIPYMFMDTVFDNRKLKTAGYKLKYPDPWVGMNVTLKWYARNKMLPRMWYLTHPDWQSYWREFPDEAAPLASRKTADLQP